VSQTVVLSSHQSLAASEDAARSDRTVVSGVTLTREFRVNLMASVAREIRRLQDELPIDPGSRDIFRGLSCTSEEIKDLLFDPRLERLAFVRGVARRDTMTGLREGVKLLIVLRRSDRARLR